MAIECKRCEVYLRGDRIEVWLVESNPWLRRKLGPLEPHAILSLSADDVPDLVNHLEMAAKSIKRTEERRKEIRDELESHNFTKMYNEFEKKYNPYPVQMSYQSAFAKALADNLISNEEYNKARLYFGKLWDYVGD